MKRIGKVSTMLFAALFAVMILAPMVNQAHAGVLQWIWSDYIYRGYDNYYGYNIIAYLNGTTAKLKVPVYNDVSWMGPSVNITAVSLVFDTGYNLTLSTVVNATLYSTKYFDFSFTADTSILSNLWAHTYTIYVDLQDISGWKWDDYWVYQWNWYTSYKFAVYLPEQKDVMDLYMKYDSYYDSYPPYYFQTIAAHMLATQAGVEATLAQNFVNLGNFTEAKAHYQTAVSLYEQALDAEENKGVAIEDAELNATIKEGNAAEKTADAAMLNAQAIMNQSYGYILLGLGFLLIGVGAIIYGVKKPKAS
jgi:tetratricopeptide (TPR) repeat protein